MAVNDFRRLRRLARYLRKDKRRLLVVFVALIPVAIAGAIQPLLVGQAISILKGEPAFPWLSNLPDSYAVRVLVVMLFFSVLLRLILQAFQTYNIQVVGQRLTSRIREANSKLEQSLK